MFKLTEGIHVHTLNTKKFKTYSIEFRFKALLRPDIVTKRSLLANIMDINSLHYPTQIDFRKKLSELYGANFHTDVSRYGRYHVLSLNLDCIDGKIIEVENNLIEIMNFLQQVIFFPNVINGSFHEPTFHREVDKLRDDFSSRYDDKSLYAEEKLNELFFETEVQKMSFYGQLSDLKHITPENLYETYISMINNDQLDIYVVGNVKEKEIMKLLKPFNFLPRSVEEKEIFHINDKNQSVSRVCESQDINQTVLTMGLDIPVYYHNIYYYTGLIFDGLFGSMPHSKLFQIVREKENLAYSILSEMDPYRGKLTVSAGIESKEIDNTHDIILEQLNEIIEGRFTDKEVQQTKEILKSELVQLDDSPYSMIEKDYTLSLIGRDKLSVNEWIDKIDEVTNKDIIDLARLIKHKATFILIGENN